MTESEAKRYYEQRPKIFPEDEDFGMILVSAMRYALGRKTYAVKSTCKFIHPLIPYMPYNILRIMDEDITRHTEFNNLGMDIDADDWMELRANIQLEMYIRNNYT